MYIRLRHDFVLSAFVTLFLALASGLAYTAVPAPPTVLCSSPGCTSVGGRYDLGQIPDAFSRLQWPAPPSTTSTVTVSTSGELAGALVSGNRIIVRAGSYGGVSFDSSHSDIAVIAEPGAIFNGSINFGPTSHLSQPARISWSGGTINGTVNGNGMDILVDGATINGGNGVGLFWREFPQRSAVVNSTISSSNYTVISNRGGSDLIHANNTIVHSGSYNPIRVVGLSSAVFVDNLVRGNGRPSRVHAGSSLVLWERNVLEDSNLFIEPNNGGGDGAELPMRDLYVVENNFWRSGGWAFAIGEQTPGNMFNVTVIGNREHNTSCGSSSCGTMYGVSGSINNLVEQDNLVVPYGAGPSS